MKHEKSKAAQALISIAISGLLGGSAASAATLVQSTFDTDAEGWQLTTATGTNPMAVIHETAGGNPGGHIRQIGVFVGAFWNAPANFLGNQSAAYGGMLLFDLQIAAGGLNVGSDAILIGNGTTLALAIPDPNTSWQSYTIALSTGANWRVGTLAGAAATEAQIQSVLSNLTALRIRQEWIGGPDNTRLDNVMLSSPDAPGQVPEPSCLLLIAPAVGLMVLVRRRQAARIAACGRN